MNAVIGISFGRNIIPIYLKYSLWFEVQSLANESFADDTLFHVHMISLTRVSKENCFRVTCQAGEPEEQEVVVSTQTICDWKVQYK